MEKDTNKYDVQNVVTDINQSERVEDSKKVATGAFCKILEQGSNHIVHLN